MVSYAEWLFKAVGNFLILRSFLIHLYPQSPSVNSWAYI